MEGSSVFAPPKFLLSLKNLKRQLVIFAVGQREEGRMGRECISKLYIGHLPVETTEEELKTFLLAGGKGQLARNSFGVTVKKGYAFMQCCNQGKGYPSGDSHTNSNMVAN